jgi:hypothetical protein
MQLPAPRHDAAGSCVHMAMQYIARMQHVAVQWDAMQVQTSTHSVHFSAVQFSQLHCSVVPLYSELLVLCCASPQPIPPLPHPPPSHTPTPF